MSRSVRWIALVLLAAIVVAAAASGPRTYRLARIGAGYAAKQMCSCIFVGGRDFASCRLDLPPGMDRVRPAVLESGQGVRASVFGLAERTARYSEGTGCTLY